MPDPIRGIHHITAIAGDPQRNLDFYTRVLGLRLVKLTVNFDDPGTYHFYFGDAAGHPGSILTFFPWQRARPGQHGSGQVGSVAFRIPQGSIAYWLARLKQHGVDAGAPFTRFDEEILALVDPDGLQLELVASPLPFDGLQPWTAGGVPAQHAICGFAAPALSVTSLEHTAELLGDVFGLRQVGQSGNRYRFSGGEGAGETVDIAVDPSLPAGRNGAGVNHHIAWRTPDDVQQLAWRELLIARGYDVTPVRDRQYFHSIYFYEPGGILFEIATEPPGFATDESLDNLGSSLRLPPWLEPRRAELEAKLPELKLPEHTRIN